MSSVLVFEDEPLRSENQLFLLELRAATKARGYRLEEAEAVQYAERILRDHEVVLAILDIKARAPRGFASSTSDERVDDALVGVELLRRIRSGRYGVSKRDISVLMRTARMEPHVRQEVLNLGCSGYYPPTKGLEAIEKVKEILDELYTDTP